MIKSKEVLVYGKHPVFAAISNPKRKIYKIIVSKNSKADLEQFISTKNLKIDKKLIEVSDGKFISSLVQNDAVHQGLVLKTSAISHLADFEFLQKINKENSPPILILDQISDPHNIGAIIRSAIAFGVKDVVISRNGFPGESGVICKSSSGMVELANIILAGNLNQFIENLKKLDYWCFGLDGKAKDKIDKIKDYENVALVVGSEGKGIRELVKKNCDVLVNIPIANEVESLNASNAVAVALYELSK